jgi:phosphoglycerate dehydrogenase-like enzyme
VSHSTWDPCDTIYLFAALREKRIRGAALDVTFTEPLPADSPLWELDNVLLSPHSADRTAEFQFEALDQFVGNVRRWVAGEPLMNIVDKHLGY